MLVFIIINLFIYKHVGKKVYLEIYTQSKIIFLNKLFYLYKKGWHIIPRSMYQEDHKFNTYKRN